MEPRIELNFENLTAPSLETVEAYFRDARKFVNQYYPDVYNHYKHLYPSIVTSDFFLREYVWCVYTSGFNSHIVAKHFENIYPVYHEILLNAETNLLTAFDHTLEDVMWQNISKCIANRRKFDAILETIKFIAVYGYAKFSREYLQSADTMQKLAYIGPVTKFHLARNLGFDVVKPDLHLTRLADFFDFLSPLGMCQYLADNFDERLGVVDLILFYAASTFGTKDLVHG